MNRTRHAITLQAAYLLKLPHLFGNGLAGAICDAVATYRTGMILLDGEPRRVVTTNRSIFLGGTNILAPWWRGDRLEVIFHFSFQEAQTESDERFRIARVHVHTLQDSIV